LWSRAAEGCNFVFEDFLESVGVILWRIGGNDAASHQSGALRTRDLKRVTVDTTVQPKAITFPTDAKLLHAAIKGLNRVASKHGG